MTVRFISDLHFGHTNILSFDKRPYTNIEDHDKDLIHRWNSVVKNPNDITYVLGDIFWRPAEESLEIVKQLRGRKVLITGNHDKFVGKNGVHNGLLRTHFEEITELKTINLDKKKIILCHYPIPQFTGHFKDTTIHLYGHIHATFEYDLMRKWIAEGRLPENGSAHNLMYNVGAMMPYMEYTPRTLDYILENGE